MDGIARVAVDPDIMEYVMHCMYDTFLKIQRGLCVSISWHKDDDSIMITSTSRPSTKDLHQALNRFFIMYNALRRNLASEYFQLSKYPTVNVSLLNQLGERFRRIYVQRISTGNEIKLTGMRNELSQVLSYIRKYTENNERISENSERTYLVMKIENSFDEKKLITNQTEQKKVYEVKQAMTKQTAITFSRSFENKLSNLKLKQQEALKMSHSPPSRYSTSEMRRVDQTSPVKKTSTLPKIKTKKIRVLPKTIQKCQIETPTGLIVSSSLRSDTFSDSCEVFTTEISPNGKMSDDVMWLIAKNRSYEIVKIIKLHISLYGQLPTSRMIVTPGFKLPHKNLIHAAVPSWECDNSKKSTKLLLSTYRNIFRIAEQDLNASSLCIPVIGRCSAAGAMFPEEDALEILKQSIVGFTKFGFQSLRHLRIICNRRSELNYICTNLFTQLMSVEYDSRYLLQQRSYLKKKIDF